MSGTTPSYKAILKTYKACSDSVKAYFSDLPHLLDDDYEYETVVGYMFIKLEQAQNRVLYGGVIKIHRGAKDLAKRVVNQQHLTRASFKQLYANIFGQPLPPNVSDKISNAEKIRDKVIHGKNVVAGEKRRAISETLEYAEALNDEISRSAGFRPFGDMRGFKGRADSLDRRTTKWLMKGLGFGIKA